MTDDFKWVREYVEHGCDDAFRELVRRHTPLVFGTARRLLDNGAMAEEVTQAVFILLSRKAGQLRPGTILAGWLYRTTRFVAREALRQETRRARRQESFMLMNTSTEVMWQKIEPILDEALDALGSGERDAVLLRFFEEKSFAEVAGALGTTEAAAKMRVGRALEKMRLRLARKGVAVPAAALGALLATQAAGATPAGLAASASAAALAGGSTPALPLASLVKGTLMTMAWIKLRNTAIAAALLLLLGIGGMATFNRSRQPAPTQTVATFEPMAGEWEGTFAMSGYGRPEPVRQNASLSIRTGPGGRECSIEMRLLLPAGRIGQTYHFSHSLADGGRQIMTQDDPSVARLSGPGTVTASDHDARSGHWRAAFRTELPGGRGATECEWTRDGDTLVIVRHDRDQTGGEGVSEIRLRKAAPKSLPATP